MDTESASRRRFIVPLLWAVLTSFLPACSVPKFIVLDDPLSPAEHLQLGLSYEKQGNLDFAEKEYLLAAKDIPEAWLYLGNVAFSRKAYEVADQYYRKAIRRIPSDPRAYNNLAWMYYELDIRLDEAERLAEEAFRLAPSDAAAPFEDTLIKIRNRRSTVPKAAP